ncbi:MAG: CheR family methyltransferase [Rhodospirillaceae bacterium]
MTEPEALSTEDFQRLCDFLYRQTGMVLTEAKRYFVERRVVERMSATQSNTFAIYFPSLRANLAGEIEHFINAFKVNETYFYREEHQLRCMVADILPERIKNKRPGDAIRIWSVPCSTGEEPYSIAMWLLENWPLVDRYDIEIIGSDIDTNVLEAARAGVYGKRALMRLTPDLVAKYFTTGDNEAWRILDDLRGSVRLTPANIMDAAETQPFGKFDLIFCRNVLIYFDDASRRAAAENLYESLMPGGYICLGHAESMSRISPLFEVCRFPDAIVYRRPLE